MAALTWNYKYIHIHVVNDDERIGWICVCTHLLSVQGHGDVIRQLAAHAKNDPFRVLHLVDIHYGLLTDQEQFLAFVSKRQILSSSSPQKKRYTQKDPCTTSL